MNISSRRSAQIVAGLLIAIVVMQAVYFGFSSVDGEINRAVIWTTEAVAFLGIAVFALVCLVRRADLQLVWAAITVSGVLNLVQAGMGLAMFAPLREAGDAMAPAYQAILAGAFSLYFAGKFLFGTAAIVVGPGLLSGSTAGRIVGISTALAGLAAMAVNLAAMGIGMTMVFAAGATGTVATLALAIALAMAMGTREQLAEARAGR